MMKGLLHSKYFKKNLSKWLFMYVLCMGLFTTIITYSKYISNIFSSYDKARVSKFNINLIYCKDESCSNEGTAYDPEKYRPTGEIVYYFAVDSSNLEVNADVIFTISVDNHFKIKKVEEITNSDSKITNVSKNGNNDKIVSISDSFLASSNILKRYKVTVIYDETVIDYNKSSCKKVSEDCKVVNGVILDDYGVSQYIFDEEKVFDVLKIGYSAIQKK